MAEGVALLEALPICAPIPADLDPLADGIFMQHQKDWVADKSDLKLCEKGRRTGITFAEALDCTLIAAAQRSAGGDNVFYIGDTKEKGLEFIRYCAHFARVVGKELGATVEEFLFEDKQPSGESKFINAYRIRFASGYAIVALSSRPANIRGLQGVVVIDEAAFHKDVQEVINAANALLIWGGKIRVISTHNGEDSPFKILIDDIKKGDFDYSLHRYTFKDADDNGLFARVCLMRGWENTAEAHDKWYKKILKSYGNDNEARDEELFCKPRRGSGAYFSRAMIKRCMVAGIPVVHFTRPGDWFMDDGRLGEARDWFLDTIKPIIDNLPTDKRIVFGQDFGRDGDLSVIWVLQEEAAGLWRTAFILEMRKIPFDVQEQVLFDLLDALPNWHHGKLDARGNGQSHAEKAQQRYGLSKIECVKATVEWYAKYFPEYRAAYEDRSIIVPDSEDIIADHRLAILYQGRPKMDDKRIKGADGLPRHGDSTVAGLLAWAATIEGFEPAAGTTNDNDPEAYIPESRRQVTGRLLKRAVGSMFGRGSHV
ncbi:hypothetical protein [Magnetovibrio sp.]|uniref:hypothetical protein n=1 Tax=Magnetovibrio sp. TaxID=2024836 RepID=UPI002F91D22C